MFHRSIFFVLGLPMNSKFATYNAFQVEPLYQPNDDGKTASVYQFSKPYVAIVIDNTNFAQLAASTLQICTSRNRIQFSRKSFSTTANETLFQSQNRSDECFEFSIYHFDIFYSKEDLSSRVSRNQVTTFDNFHLSAHL